MFVKRQYTSQFKPSSFYKETPEQFLDEIDVDSCFYQNRFDISQSQDWIARVSRGSNKKSFAINLFLFCDLKIKQCCTLQEEKNISKRELISLILRLRDLLKTFDEEGKCIQTPLLQPKMEIASKKSQYNLCTQTYQAIFEHSGQRIRLSFRFGNNKPSVLSLKKFEVHDNHL